MLLDVEFGGTFTGKGPVRTYNSAGAEVLRGVLTIHGTVRHEGPRTLHCEAPDGTIHFTPRNSARSIEPWLLEIWVAPVDGGPSRLRRTELPAGHTSPLLIAADLEGNVLQRIRLSASTTNKPDALAPPEGTGEELGEKNSESPSARGGEDSAHPTTGKLPPASAFPVAPNESRQSVVAKLSALRPTPAQADFVDLETTAFIHFGPNTFYDQSWGNGTEDPATFLAPHLDTDQWARTFAEAGFRLAMLTVKHHDGFLLWDSRYCTHSWAATPQGGDLFRQFVDSCAKYGLNVGLYLSPADSYQEIQGVWGNGSAPRTRTIPTLVPGDSRAEAVAAGTLPTFEFEATDYGAYMLNTLYETLTEYGPIAEVWFDGAQGLTEGTEFYDYAAFYQLICCLQPNAVIANGAPDVRWVGNEEGWARRTEWSPQAVRVSGRDRPRVSPSEMSADGELGTIDSVISQIRSGAAQEVRWLPAEVDAKNAPEWFYQSGHVPHSAERLVRMYEESAGRNAVFLLNVPPQPCGLIAEDDARILREFRAELDRRYGADLGLQAQRVDAADGSCVQLHWAEPVTIDAVRLCEDVREAGQQVEQAVVEVQGPWGPEAWREVVRVSTIGQRRIVRLESALTVRALRVRVIEARGPVRFGRVAAFARGASSE